MSSTANSCGCYGCGSIVRWYTGYIFLLFCIFYSYEICSCVISRVTTPFLVVLSHLLVWLLSLVWGMTEILLPLSMGGERCGRPKGGGHGGQNIQNTRPSSGWPVYATRAANCCGCSECDYFGFSFLFLYSPSWSRLTSEGRKTVGREDRQREGVTHNEEVPAAGSSL